MSGCAILEQLALARNIYSQGDRGKGAWHGGSWLWLLTFTTKGVGCVVWGQLALAMNIYDQGDRVCGMGTVRSGGVCRERGPVSVPTAAQPRLPKQRALIHKQAVVNGGLCQFL